MKIRYICAFWTGLVLAQTCTALTAHAESSTSDTYRVVIALEKIASALQSIDKKMK